MLRDIPMLKQLCIPGIKPMSPGWYFKIMVRFSISNFYLEFLYLYLKSGLSYDISLY